MRARRTTTTRHRARPAAGAIAGLLMGLLAIAIAGCQSLGERRLEARDPPRASRADAPCTRLAERLLGVAYDGQVLAELSPAARPEADEESLVPLEACLSRFEEPRWAERPWLLRSLSHAYGLVVVGSRTLEPAEKRRRLTRLSLDDVRAYWEARLAESEGALLDAIARYRDAIAAAPELADAKLGLASALLRTPESTGAREEALAILNALPPETAPRLHAILRAEAARQAGDLDAAARLYDEALHAKPPARTRDPDATALASLPAPSDREIACTLGALHEARKDLEAALARYREGECAPALVDALLASGRNFDALVELSRRDPTELGESDPERIADLFERLGAYETALSRRERMRAVCMRLSGGARCEAHEAHVQALRELLAAREKPEKQAEKTPSPEREARKAAREAAQARAAIAVKDALGDARSAEREIALGDAALSEDGARALVEARVGEAAGFVELSREGDDWRVEGLSGALR